MSLAWLVSWLASETAAFGSVVVLEAGTGFSASLLTAAELEAIASELAVLALATAELASETASEATAELAAELVVADDADDEASEATAELAAELVVADDADDEASEVADDDAVESLVADEVASLVTCALAGAAEVVAAEAVLLTLERVRPANTAVVARPAKTMFFLALYIL